MSHSCPSENDCKNDWRFLRRSWKSTNLPWFATEDSSDTSKWTPTAESIWRSLPMHILLVSLNFIVFYWLILTCMWKWPYSNKTWKNSKTTTLISHFRSGSQSLPRNRPHEQISRISKLACHRKGNSYTQLNPSHQNSLFNPLSPCFALLFTPWSSATTLFFFYY